MLFSIQASFSDATILAHLVLLFRFLSPVPLHVNAGERSRAPMDSSFTSLPCITYHVTSLSHDLCPPTRQARADKQSPLRYPIMSNKLRTKSHP